MEAAVLSVNDSLYDVMRRIERQRETGDYVDKPLSPRTIQAMQTFVALDEIVDLVEDIS